ncbi:hypothetical protein MJT46_019437, partial [Ovis ammon polii x Ovis aries]
MSRKQRNRCQYCRLLKCLQMGMNRKGKCLTYINTLSKISEEEIERIMSGQEFEEEANHWSNHGDSDHSSPGNRASESKQPSPGSTLSSSRSMELNGFVAFRDQYMGMSVPPHYQYIPHLFSYSAHSPLLPPQARSLDPQSYSLIHQLVSAEDLEPLGTPMLIEDGYAVTQAELFALLCRLADELLFRQIAWIKKLPFFCELSIKDYTCLLSSTWQELILLSSLTVYSKQIFGELADITAKYSPSDEELHRFSDEGMEVIERLIYLYHKFHQLKVSNEEYACMKAINFLNQDIRGLTSASQLEQLNKRYWYICQDFTEYKYTHQPNRFPDLMMCLPEIRYIAGNGPWASNPSLLFLICEGNEESSVFRMVMYGLDPFFFHYLPHLVPGNVPYPLGFGQQPHQGGEEEEEDGRTGPAYCPPAARRGVKKFPCAHGHHRPTWATRASPRTPSAHWPPSSSVRARLPLRKSQVTCPSFPRKSAAVPVLHQLGERDGRWSAWGLEASALRTKAPAPAKARGLGAEAQMKLTAAQGLSLQ